MINLQPETGKENTNVLKTVAQITKGLAGVYGSVQRLGDIQVGYPIYLE